MPRFGKRVLISPSQEEILEAITGWDDTRQAAGIMDETPSQPAYAENSSQSSLERVFDVTGSSLCPGPSQEAVKLASPPDMSLTPRTTRNVAWKEIEEDEDSYNEAFESDRSQSPPRTVSWSSPAGAHGCKDGPRPPTASTTLNAVALEEVDRLPLRANLKLVNEVEVSNNRPIAIPPEAPGVTIRVRGGLEVDQEAIAVEAVAEEKSGRRAGSATVREANGGAGGESRTTADGEAQQHASSGGTGLVCPRGSPLHRGSLAFKPSSFVGEGFGSGSASAHKSLRRQEEGSPKDPLSALSDEHHTAFGLDGETSVRSAGNNYRLIHDTLDLITNSVQVNGVQVIVELKMGEDDDPGDKCKKRRSIGEPELDNMESVGGRGVCVERIAAHSKALKDELGTQRASDHCQSGKEYLGGQEKSREPLLSPTPSKSQMDAEIFRLADKTGVTSAGAGATEVGHQCSPPSSPRPPIVVQKKLNKLRSQPKRDCSERVNLLNETLRTERDMISSSIVLEAIKLRSGTRPAGNVTAADLLKTALAVGITLPPPFHRNYFSE